MSASDQMRAMLDQLMGTARNGEYNPVNRATQYAEKLLIDIKDIKQNFNTTYSRHAWGTM